MGCSRGGEIMVRMTAGIKREYPREFAGPCQDRIFIRPRELCRELVVCLGHPAGNRTSSIRFTISCYCPSGAFFGYVHSKPIDLESSPYTGWTTSLASTPWSKGRTLAMIDAMPHGARIAMLGIVQPFSSADHASSFRDLLQLPAVLTRRHRGHC